MLRLEDINKQYGQFAALSDINLNIPEGQIFGIIGASGAGKSSLLRVINLLERPTTGQVYFQDQNITTQSAKQLRQTRLQIGMIFQHFNLLKNKTVYDNVALPLRLLGQSANEIEKTVKPLLELTQIADKTQCYPSELSGGQKQRVAIARALASSPKMLLCDEATSALDPETTKAILSLLKDINRRLKLTIVLITHEMSVVKAICDRVALIEKGRIVRDEPVIDFFLKPHDSPDLEFLNAYLAHELPELIQSRLEPTWQAGHSPVLRIYFRGEAANKPLIAEVSRVLGFDINILQGNIEFINNQPVGKLVVSVEKSDGVITRDELAQVKVHLTESGLVAEVLGYVA